IEHHQGLEQLEAKCEINDSQQDQQRRQPWAHVLAPVQLVRLGGPVRWRAKPLGPLTRQRMRNLLGTLLLNLLMNFVGSHASFTLALLPAALRYGRVICHWISAPKRTIPMSVSP